MRLAGDEEFGLHDVVGVRAVRSGASPNEVHVHRVVRVELDRDRHLFQPVFPRLFVWLVEQDVLFEERHGPREFEGPEVGVPDLGEENVVVQLKVRYELLSESESFGSCSPSSPMSPREIAMSCPVRRSSSLRDRADDVSVGLVTFFQNRLNSR